MSQANTPADLFMFDEAMPLSDLQNDAGFKSECKPDKKNKIEDLFRFRRGLFSSSITL